MNTPSKLDEARLRELAEAAGGGIWFAGHLCRDDHSCDCPYIFDEGHAGGIATVHVDNGLPVSEGGNDAPERKLAQAHQSFIAAANPATILALLDALSAERERGAEGA